MFGGQVLGQALIAAARTVDAGRLPHSLHGYFLRPGNAEMPILFEVDRIRDGKSFTARRVVAIQNGKAVFNMAVSFHGPKQGFEHQADMPIVSTPGGYQAIENVGMRCASYGPSWTTWAVVDVGLSRLGTSSGATLSIKRYIHRSSTSGSKPWA